MTRLADGTVLVAGGANGPAALATAEFAPTTPPQSAGGTAEASAASTASASARTDSSTAPAGNSSSSLEVKPLGSRAAGANSSAGPSRALLYATPLLALALIAGGTVFMRRRRRGI